MNNKLINLPHKNISRIAFLDYLRIFAFLSVLVGHLFFGDMQRLFSDPSIHATPRFLVGLLMPLCESGGAGVVVFFLISGYIITSVLQSENTVSFLVKRFFRIYPLYIFAVLSQFGLEWWFSGANWPLLAKSKVIPQLLLLGDFYGNGYALGGVEWTLRVELYFYLLMAAFNSFGLIKIRNKYLPLILFCILLALVLFAPLRRQAGFSHGYISAFGPFLLLGAFFFLYEKRQITFVTFAAMLLFVLGAHYKIIATHVPSLMNMHFATLGVCIFTLFWLLRDRFSSKPIIVFLSSLAYSVYLTHNWLFNLFKKVTQDVKFPVSEDIIALLFLFAVCYLIMRFIEVKGINAGKIVINKFPRHLKQI